MLPLASCQSEGRTVMVKLVEPQSRYLQSYMEAFEEYKAHNVTAYGLSDAKSYNVFEKFENYREEKNLKPDRVGAHFFWLVDDEEDYFIGEISIRHTLNSVLERYGGHIGYGIRFGEWNKGYGTVMLKAALEEAKKIGLTKVLITCDDNNIGSAKIMEKNGFALNDRIENHINGRSFVTRRYWKML